MNIISYLVSNLVIGCCSPISTCGARCYYNFKHWAHY